MTNGVTVDRLESHLWEAANILRGPVDAADFKTYVFPLLFFKRISDVHDEEYAAALAESGGDEEYARFPQNYRFLIPKGCHWSDVRAVAVNVGQVWGKLFAQEKNLTTSAIARMNLFLHGASDFQVVRGDTLRQPAFFSGDNLATFDCVIANPPFSLEKWGEEVWTSDPYGRNFAGMPPGKSGDYAWVQHMIRSMAPATGRMAVVLPHGALFRMGKEGAIRQKILQMDLLDAVIGLGPNLFYGTGLAACILVFRQRKKKARRKKVLIVDASREFKTGRAQNELLPEHVDRIHVWYRDYRDVDGIARVVTLDDIAANDFNLNIPRYVEPKNEHDVLTVDEAMRNLRTSAEAAFAAEEKLIGILRREGILIDG